MTNPLGLTDSQVRVIVVCAAIVFLTLCVALPIIGAYNMLVDADLQVSNAQANIQTDLERRADLIPNLASTVSGSATFEYKTMVDTIAARSNTAQELKNRIKTANTADELAQSDRSTAALIGGIMTLTENYPTLQSTQQFREFSAQVTATENEILVDRQTYNAAVRQYQSVVKSFPTCYVASYFGFPADKHQMYEPANSTYANTVPTVTFNFTGLAPSV